MEEYCFYSNWGSSASASAAFTQYQTQANYSDMNAPNWIPPPTVSNPFFDDDDDVDTGHGFQIPSWMENIVEEDQDGAPAPAPAPTASNNHNQAEKQRRDRINSHLATLRKLIPSSDKMDKATLLGNVIEHVKDSKKEAMELSKVFTLPLDTDQVIVDSNQNQDSFFLKASICCEDRVGLFSELNDALKGLNLTLVESHITSLGGRIQVSFILTNTTTTTKLETDALKRSLKLVLGRIVSSSATSNICIRSKRQKFFFSST